MMGETALQVVSVAVHCAQPTDRRENKLQMVLVSESDTTSQMDFPIALDSASKTPISSRPKPRRPWSWPSSP